MGTISYGYHRTNWSIIPLMDKKSANGPGARIIARSPVFYASLFLLLTGAVMDIINSEYVIPKLFPNRAPIPDTLFTILPYIPSTQYLTDLANIFSVILLVLYIFPKRWIKLPLALAVLGLGYLLRSVFTLLNPFDGALGNGVHYGLTNVHQYGEFPSGHVFLVVAIYFLIQADAPTLKKLALLSVIVEIITLLLSHGHYSVDIIGGWLIGYFAYHSLSGYKGLTISPPKA